MSTIVGRPEGGQAKSTRLLADRLRPLCWLGAYSNQPVGVRLRLGLLQVYLAMPIHLTPGFILGLGYDGDTIVVVSTLRGVARRTDVDRIRPH